MARNNTDNTGDPNFGYFTNLTEVGRLRFTITKFKEYDAKRKLYILDLKDKIAEYKAKVKKLEGDVETLREEMNSLVDAYDGAKPLLNDPTHKAYVFKLLETIQGLKSQVKAAVEQDTARRFKEKLGVVTEENIRLRERVTALERAYNVLTGGRRKVID